MWYIVQQVEGAIECFIYIAAFWSQYVLFVVFWSLVEENVEI